MAGLSDADQSEFSLSRFDIGRAHRVGPNPLHGPSEAQQRAKRVGDTGVVELVLQVADDGAGAVSGARSVHPDDEDEEHAAASARRRVDHAPGAGVLRLAFTSASTRPGMV